MSGSLPEALQKLASFRAQNSRQSLQIVTVGAPLLQSSYSRNGDAETCASLEQLALASIDIGRLEIADECLALLTARFPGSPRVKVLEGIRKEASLPAEAMVEYYDALIGDEEVNAAAWKRKISVLRRMGEITKATDELCNFLDTFYSDIDGWLELTDIYSSCGKYDYALHSIQHALLLAPQNPFHALHAAEIAYTAGDMPLALKLFLNAVDLTDDPELDAAARVEAVPEGVAVRIWFGVKQCTRRLITDPRGSGVSPSHTPIPEHVNLLDELATERLLTSYSTYAGAGPSRKGPVRGREELVKWLEAK